MRLYAPAKPSSSTGEGDSRPLELTRRSNDNNDHRPDDKLQLNAPRIDDKTQPNHNSRLDDKFHLNGPLRHEQTPPTTGVVDLTTTPTTSINTKKTSPPTTMTIGPHRNCSYNSTEINGVPATTTTTTTTTISSAKATTQNGPSVTSPVLENGTDSLRSLDSIPWNLEGTETIIENGSKSAIKNGSIPSEEDELKRVREDNKKLKAALEEAAEVNGQWRQYHDERQGYVQRLLTTIHELQHAHSSTAPSPRQLDGEVGTGGVQEGEVRRLREAMTRLQADHHEHVQLLEMQVRAHRDDWEAERSEKRSAEAALAETEARAALLLQEIQLLQAKLADSESKRGLCWRCLCPRTDYNNHRSGSNSAPRTPQASPIPAPGGGASPAPVVPSAPQPDNPPAPLKGWIPVSMLHQIAFSGATPEHQTPVVQSQPHQQQQSNRNHAAPQTPQLSQNVQNQQQQQIHLPQPLLQQQQQKPHQFLQPIQQQQSKQQNLQVQQQQFTRQPQQIQHQKQPVAPCVTKPASVASTTYMRGSDFVHINNNTHENGISKGSNITGVADDKKRYEAMGARPKILGNLQSLSGKGVGIMEDEKSAKHRARSILASAIPVSPVSSGPSTPCGISVTKSSSSSSMPKGYVPVTSTVLTPVNFRPPFVAHKRPSAMKHIVQVSKQTSPHQISSSNVPSSSTHIRSDSSPASLCAGDSTDVNKSQIANQTGNTITDHQYTTLNKNSAYSSKPNYSNNTQSGAQTNDVKKSPTPNVKKAAANSTVDNDSHKDISTAPSSVSKQKPPENTESISVVTTTISCSSPPISTTTASLSNNMNGPSTSSRTSNTNSFSQYPASGSTAFAAVTVTTTSAGNHTNSTTTTSSYSSTTSSRSSSPGISLTTFGLNSEGRGIPGAICFALGSDQKVSRNPHPCRTSNTLMSPPPDSVTAGQSQKDVRPPSEVKSPTIIINCAPAPTTVKEEHWWSVESPGRNNKQQNNQSGKLVNSTWVRLMGGQANNRPGSGLPWRTARAVSGQHLIQTRRTSQEETCSNGTTSPNSVCSSTATFNYTPAVNSPPSSNLSSATNSAPSSPPPNPNQAPCDDLRSMASKNITSAIMSYELNTKCETVQTPSEVNTTQGWSGKGSDTSSNDGVATMTRRDLVCPSCQMLFPPEKHLEFLDHFEVCRGPEYADL